MIGVNDTNTEVFTLQNARDFVTWARGQLHQPARDPEAALSRSGSLR